MYEYHGWATIVISTTEDPEDEDELLINAVTMIESQLNSIQQANIYGGIQVVNGEYHLWLTGCSNHKYSWSENLTTIFHTIAKYAPASYGLIYIRDDEDREGFDNDFQILRLCRGQISRHRDTLLSPCIPVIEDRYHNQSQSSSV